MLLVALSAIALFGCSSSEDQGGSTTSEALGPAGSALSATTTTIANRAPEFRRLSVARAELGQRFSEAIIASDPDGDDVTVRLGSAPPGFAPIINSRGSITGFDWRPLEAGEWEVEVTATDPFGARTTEAIQLVARAARSVPLVLSMGDSIAAGFGRDRSDFLGTDDCFRSEDDAYATRTTEALVDAGALAEDAEVLLLGCAGATSESLLAEPIHATDDAGGREEGERSPVAWAAMLNPTIITVTIGGEDMGFFERDLPLGDVSDVASSRRELESQLDRVLDQLLRTTDAHIAITTYYDPTASDPIGVEGCRGDCFSDAMGALVDQLNDAIVGSSERASADRVSIVHLDGENDVWEASNGLGPDFLRENLGPFGGVLDRFTQGSSATCADGGSPPEDLVSSLDCVHPNTAGHRRISQLVTDALLSL